MKLLVTGFGPFPGAPENPSEALIKALARESPEKFGASALKAVVLKTEYRRSWETLRRLYSSFAPGVVVHFGLNGKAEAIHIECVGCNAADPAKPDAGGYAPASAVLSKGGAAALASTFPAKKIAAVLKKAGFPVVLSDDAGGYVCNATLYRSIRASPPTRLVGFVHVPRAERLSPERLLSAAKLILTIATRS